MIRVGVEHRRRTEAGHLAGPVDLAAEAPPELGVPGMLGPQHLDRHQAAVRRASKKDGAHATLTKTTEQLIVTEPPRIVRHHRMGHTRPDSGVPLGLISPLTAYAQAARIIAMPCAPARQAAWRSAGDRPPIA